MVLRRNWSPAKTCRRSFRSVDSPQMEFLYAMALSFFPREWRRSRYSGSASLLERAALAGALAQFVCFGLIFRWRLHYHMQALEPFFGEEVYGTGFVGVLLALATELVDPIGLPSLYLTLEGVVRGIAALVVEEVFPTLPISLAFFLSKRWKLGKRVRNERRIDEEFGDHVAWMGDKLVISSARPKEDWDASAISIRGEFYLATGPHQGSTDRPYSYILLPWPAGQVLRKVRQYDTPIVPARKKS